MKNQMDKYVWKMIWKLVFDGDSYFRKYPTLNNKPGTLVFMVVLQSLGFSVI